MAGIVNEATYQANFLSSLKASKIVDRNHEIAVPNPVEEGKVGYDIKIDFDKVGIPVFLQFKAAEETTQARKISIHKELSVDTSKLMHRMVLRQNNNFLQHRNLMNIDKKKLPTAVYYSTPNYKTEDEYRSAARENYMQYKSTFLSPREIGKIPTNSAHEINYFLQPNKALLYPKNSNNNYKIINAYTFDDVIKSINRKLNRCNRHLEINIDKILKRILKERYEEEMKKLRSSIIVDHINKGLEHRPSPRTTHLKYLGATDESHYSTFSFNEDILRDDSVFSLYKLNYLQKFSRANMGSEVIIFYQEG